MQRLLCLGMEGQPAAELIPGTVEIWQERFARCDARRLSMAFDAIEANSQRWPTPAAIFEAMPTYVHTYQAAPVGAPQIAHDKEASESSNARVQAVIAECARKLGA